MGGKACIPSNVAAQPTLAGGEGKGQVRAIPSRWTSRLSTHFYHNAEDWERSFFTFFPEVLLTYTFLKGK